MKRISLFYEPEEFYDVEKFAPSEPFLLLRSGSQPLLLQGSLAAPITLDCVNIYDLIVTYGHITAALPRHLHLWASSDGGFH